MIIWNTYFENYANSIFWKKFIIVIEWLTDSFKSSVIYESDAQTIAICFTFFFIVAFVVNKSYYRMQKILSSFYGSLLMKISFFLLYLKMMIYIRIPKVLNNLYF